MVPAGMVERNGGGAEGNRTPDLLIANEALSQLSYSPVAGRKAPLMMGAFGEVNSESRPIPEAAGGTRGRSDRGMLRREAEPEGSCPPPVSNPNDRRTAR